jgi:hypothetical protein
MKSRERMAKKEKKAGNKDDRRLAAAISEKSSEKTAKQPPKAKITSAAERRKNRIDGIIKTVYPSVLGGAAGFACYYAGEALAPYPWHFVMLSIILVTFLIQKHTYNFLNIDADGFKTKDWFYVEFMVVDLWLVTWTLLLN